MSLVSSISALAERIAQEIRKKVSHDELPSKVWSAGETRPTAPLAGQMFFDTAIGKPLWWDGSVWKDSTGVTAP